jgi:hypothetical protein
MQPRLLILQMARISIRALAEISLKKKYKGE